MTRKDEKLKSVIDSAEKDGQLSPFLIALIVGLVTLGE